MRFSRVLITSSIIQSVSSAGRIGSPLSSAQIAAPLYGSVSKTRTVRVLGRSRRSGFDALSVPVLLDLRFNTSETLSEVESHLALDLQPPSQILPLLCKGVRQSGQWSVLPACLLYGGRDEPAHIGLTLAFRMLVGVGKVDRPLQVDMHFHDCIPRQIVSALHPHGEGRGALNSPLKASLTEAAKSAGCPTAE